jgi:hypothetical protein
MAQAETMDRPKTEGFGATERKDPWWVGPTATGLGLGAFLLYGAIRAALNSDYRLGMGTGVMEDHAYLLSPFYSPLFLLPTSLAWISPAFLVLWAPGGFRVTCYYYRKAYYRAFFLDPPGCAVGEPSNFCGLPRGRAYKGETKLLLFQNLHRYFLYIALAFLVILALDVVHSLRWPNGFGVSIGSLVLATSTTLLTFYTLSCHSFRHLVGGRLDSFARDPMGRLCYRLWLWATKLNANHMLWAWASLFGVGFADFYVWMVASGRITDLRLI